MKLRGYGRLILKQSDLHEEIADTLNIVNFLGSKELALQF